MTKKEQTVQSEIMSYLTDEVGAHVTKYNVDGYGRKGEPDLFASIPHDPYPIAVYIEVKKVGGVLSPLQKVKVKRLKEAGHLVLVADKVEIVKHFIHTL